ncbi:MAG: hypothetical protein ABIK98_11020 [Pseudomonadota bacterium]|uniref:Lipoprotein n=1 Tax=Candidatus Desulfatibia profunda TaxID=2841695 RepID=A0A8J6NNA1_9BACT|nr:hypothetical protein [Candidatus Desulfatibia profunda]MBL7179341.1 hypothetical protein [Desulfobacterales bacterium]
MTKARPRHTVLMCIGLAAVFCFIVSGCSALKSKRTSPEPQVTAKRDKESAPLYYDFGDVLIPKELKVDKKASYIVQSPGFLTGILALKGNVERNSLIAFFENNMAKDNWREVSLFKSPQTSTIMLFQKENRWCVISINEKGFNTYVEIGVAPTLGESGSGLLK